MLKKIIKHVLLSVGDINNFPIGANGYSIDWYRDNQPLNRSQNQWSYAADQPGVYTYELRQGTCVTRSNPVVVRTGTIAPPVIDIYQPKTGCPGDSRTLNLYSLYSAFQSCQWQKDGVDIAGATGSSFAALSSGSYTVRATKGSCSATSQPISLTFANALIPVINVQGASAGCANVWLDVRYYAQQSGTQFQWYKDGTVLSGATDNTYNTLQPGLYAVRVTNGNCTGLSKGVYTRPFTSVKPIISAVPSSVCGNNTVRLTAPNLFSNIQWKRNGEAVTGGNSWSYFPTQSGLYSVYAGGCGGAESDPVEIKIGEPTSASLTTGALIASGQTAQVPVTFTGSAPWSFTLSNGQSVTGVYQNPYSLPVSPTTTTSYSITRVENVCGTGTSIGSATVRVGSGNADLSLSSIVSSRTPHVGDIISYSLVLTNDGPMDAYSIQLTNRLPAGIEFVDAQSSGISADNGVVTATIGSLFLNSSVTVSYRLRIVQTGTFVNAVQVAASNMPDPDSQPNSGTGDGEDDQSTVDLRTSDGDGTLIVSANPNQTPLLPVVSNQPPTPPGTVELSLAIQSSQLTPKAGEVVSLSLIVSNRGRATATNLVVQTQLPPGWLVSNSDGFVVNGQTVLSFINQLPAGTSQVLVLPVVVNSNGQVQAQIQDVTEPVSNATPGNGYTNGERDEANLALRVR